MLSKKDILEREKVRLKKGRKTLKKIKEKMRELKGEKSKELRISIREELDALTASLPEELGDQY